MSDFNLDKDASATALARRQTSALSAAVDFALLHGCVANSGEYYATRDKLADPETFKAIFFGVLMSATVSDVWNGALQRALRYYYEYRPNEKKEEI